MNMSRYMYKTVVVHLSAQPHINICILELFY